jgi:predicted small metal-binding protein
MFSIACKDMGIECDHVITGDTKEAALAAGMAHVKEVHMTDPKVMEMMKMPEAEMTAMAMSMVKDA